jgi:hypothetical protein
MSILIKLTKLKVIEPRKKNTKDLKINILKYSLTRCDLFRIKLTNHKNGF